MIKTTFFRHTLWVSALALLGFGAPTQAAVFCVNNAKMLQSVLNTAAINNANDEIRIVQGTYVGNFVYNSTQANKLSVLGGYAKGCVSRTLNPVNTVLDGNQADTVLALSAPDVTAVFLVEGLTLRKGQHATNPAHGGGLYALTSTGTVTVRRNRFENNTAGEDNSGSGGGIHVSADTLVLNNNHFSGNTSSYGGGAYVEGSQSANNIITIVNNRFYKNTGIGGGGAYIYSYRGTVTLTNNSIVGNRAETGAGLRIDLGNTDTTDSATLYNNLFWGNVATARQGADLSIENDGNRDSLPTPVTLFGNNFKHSAAGFQITTPITIHASNHNGLNPLFVNAAKNDLHLSPGSPMINVGYANTPNLPATDLDGKPRVLGGRVDIGAYEFNDSSDNKPDFRVTKLEPIPASPKANGLFSVTITVQNEGAVSANGGWLDVWAHAPKAQTCGTNGDAYVDVGTLAAGASKTLTITGLRAGKAGTYTLRAFVDSYCQTTELDDNNNQDLRSYTIVPLIKTYSNLNKSE